MPVVFIHCLWPLASSWDRWGQLFSVAGYAPLTPDWPDNPETVEEARADPGVFAKKTLRQIAGKLPGLAVTEDRGARWREIDRH
jgi:non-heme chloroperoxidase